MKYFLLLSFAILGFCPSAKADMLFTHCEKWTAEGWAHFPCSNGKTYAVGNAICSTVDSRRNVTPNLSHGPKPIEIMCRFGLRNDPTKCLYDRGDGVEDCLKEHSKNGNKPKPVAGVKPPATS